MSKLGTVEIWCERRTMFAVEFRLIPGPLSSLLPEKTRRKIFPENCQPTANDSALSGLTEMLLSMSGLAYMYFHIVPAAINGYIGQASARPGGSTAMVEWAGGVPVAYGMGLTALARFLLRWQTLLAAYLAFEGSVRTLAGFGAEQIVPSMPLQVAEWSVLRAHRAIRRMKLPPLTVDEVTQEGDHLRIESCRAKADWHHSACVSYQDNLYELVEERAGNEQRPWVYRLRPAPAHKVVRGMRYYDPRDVLKN